MNKVDLVVLGFLSRMPMHGYQIAEFFEKRGIEFWVKIKMPSVYKALNRLEDKGCLSAEVEVDENNRARKVYSITASGRQYFLELLDEIFFSEKFVSPVDFWNGFRFLQGNVSKEYFLNLVERRLGDMEQHKAKLEKNRENHEGEFNLDNIPFYQKLLMEHMCNMKNKEFELLKNMLIAADLPENSKAFQINEKKDQ